ncbi:MAG: pilus assembly protein TadG-related protein [Candidatus Omnitrophica bacterium]|nr:pilus assembly protein TadG-related protein [Candidatus Omnitrophota bacterium]
MFICFSKNKFRHEKGQLVPIFIIVLVVLIIMAMVSVNLSKVAMTKTYGANGADAGALAGGATMANLFNGIAKTNSSLEAYYEMFLAEALVSFGIALTNLIAAETAATAATTAAASALANANPTMVDLAMGFAGQASASATLSATNFKAFYRKIFTIEVAVLAFWYAQWQTYDDLRTSAEKNYRYAKGYVYTFAFVNSGISNKLKSGSAPEDIAEPNKVLKEHNYQGNFSTFLTGISDYSKTGRLPDVETYGWMDGQEREHYVTVNGHIDPVDNFDLQVCLFPLAVEEADLITLMALGITNFDEMTSAAASFKEATIHFLVACKCCKMPHGAACCGSEALLGAKSVAIGTVLVDSALSTMGIMYATYGLAVIGITPARDLRDNESDMVDIICWINDVNDPNTSSRKAHNRLVTVKTTQSHQGGDLGLWQTAYPDIVSDSVVNFKGHGSIDPPKFSKETGGAFDADITSTDKINIENQ